MCRTHPEYGTNIDNKDIFNILTTNARSIAPKIDCLVYYLDEMNTSIALLSETWLSDSDSDELVADLRELKEGTGYKMLVNNRPKNARGYLTGGVAIVYKSSRIKFRELTIPVNNFELSLIHI